MEPTGPYTRSVVPIVGVTLLIAITGALAFIFGLFAIAVADTASTPYATFEFDEEGNTVTIVHTGGDGFHEENSHEVSVETTSGTVVDEFDVDDGVRAGDSATVVDVGEGVQIRVVWTAPNGDLSRVLTKYDVSE